ncbi:hypothetical protein [Mycetocola zhadangensis]|uniref:Uncharacterized protein n=1 Tax=Mycetocola zhadangensis TaxID=1164595 RepID=A0A3L7J7B5_9MICO|nr:hypothetical protein [Mycetocola zhadangensis]RLQ84402.1 hypothetical protein D9V28_09420 [Mycetocola zhadangensis]GGE93283.1 hypothetical protein GCM10011313_15400 [Mycetocola zhadangensis]
MSTLISSTKLHLNKREITFAVPLYITGLVAVVSVLISFLFWRAGSQPGSEGWISGSQSNPGILYSLAGFLVYLGVQSVATTFPFALSLGATRRGFAGGTVLWAVLVSAYLAFVFAVLTTIEIATDHWFAGFYVFDVYVLGAGDLSRLLPTVFLGTLSMLTIGGVFGAAWLRFGARGPQVIGVGVGLVLVLALIVLIPSAAEILGRFELWWLAVTAAVVIALSSAGMWSLLRSAIVR